MDYTTPMPRIRRPLLALVATSALALGPTCERQTGAVTTVTGVGSQAHETTPSSAAPIPEGGTERPKRLILGLAPTMSSSTADSQYRTLAAYLSEQVALPIDVRLAPSYAALSQALTRFEIHAAILPPYIYVQAKRDNPALVLIATEIADGSPTYASYIIVRDDSGIETIEQLRGRRFGFVNIDSTTGYLYPYAYLRALDIQPATFFSEVVFAGNHGRLVQMVLERRVEAGATFSAAFKQAANIEPEGRHLRVLAKTGRAPLDAYCVSPRLAQPIIANLRRALLELSTRTEEGRRVLRGFSAVNGFVAASDDDYDDVRRKAQLVDEDRP